MSSYFASSVYVLCAVTALACAAFLARGYLRSGVRLLMWSSLFFAALTIENVLLFFDLSVYPNTPLILWRHGLTLGGIAVLLFGLIWESE